MWILNHIDILKYITSKTGLIRSLKKYYASSPDPLGSNYTISDSIATSFILVVDKVSEDFISFMQVYNELLQKNYYKQSMPKKHCEQNLWLLKPANMNQGRGIEIIRNLKELQAILNKKRSHSIWVIQKYIERPMLYYERKFDIRVWVLVTDACDVFMYKDGYIRTSSEK